MPDWRAACPAGAMESGTIVNGVKQCGTTWFWWMSSLQVGSSCVRAGCLVEGTDEWLGGTLVSDWFAGRGGRDPVGELECFAMLGAVGWRGGSQKGAVEV